MIKVSLLSIAKKLIKWDGKLEIYTNGEDNDYPERMERLKNNSITAVMASRVMTQYLIGKGFGEADNLKIGEQKLIDIADDIAIDIVDHRGVFIHVNYDSYFEISDFKVLPFDQCRIGVKDSNDYNGKILVYRNWNEGKIDKSKVSILDVFNPEKKIVEKQIKTAGSTTKYKGQVFYYNMDRKYYYPLSRIDAVALESDNEHHASIYKNQGLRKGFFGKTLIITRPLIDNGFIEDESIEGRKTLARLENERSAYKEGISDFIGVENSGGVMTLEVDFAGEKLEDAVLFKDIESKIDDKLFSYTEDSAMHKILMAYNNLPISLVKSPDSALLGNSGEALKTAKETYWENTWKERNILETIINDLLKLHNEYEGGYLFIKPLITQEVPQGTAEAENAKAQANLKGSVGGVQALIQIQQSVTSGITDYTAAVIMIQKIYGFDEETSKQLLGTPKIIN
jgi:hypothetical protein